MGRHTKGGGYIIEWRKVRTYVAPANLAEFKVASFICKISMRTSSLVLQLTPFVRGRPTLGHPDYAGDPKGPLSGDRYLNRWKEENGID